MWPSPTNNVNYYFVQRATLLKSTIYPKLLPVVDLVQVVKRPLQAPNIFLQVKHGELMFAQTKDFSIASKWIIYNC